MVFICDKSDADEGTQNDDYRVVDLEWSTYRVKDYGNKKGWVLVCELISPYHDDRKQVKTRAPFAKRSP